jgi:hypothetical protein
VIRVGLLKVKKMVLSFVWDLIERRRKFLVIVGWCEAIGIVGHTVETRDNKATKAKEKQCYAA